jgi:uncharacterized protein YcbK (DUF882 family)
MGGTGGTQDAAANGDTRSLSFFHTHTRESTTITFRRNGRYDGEALTQLNWFLRDWRVNEPAKMDPRLFDILWEVYRESGSSQPINIVSAYRSPETNSALRRRSKAVSEHSQHMLGKAMDIRLPDVSTERLREIAMRLQYGGVGYYGSSAFVHLDTGSVRAWPRMSQEQLARLFPDGKTLHLPSNGKPLQGYEVAKAEVLSRNAGLSTQASLGGGPSIGSLMASLFGGKGTPPPPAAEPGPAAPEPATTPAPASPESARPITAPLPPRRPQVLLASADSSLVAPEPPPLTTANLPATGMADRPASILGYDEKAAVRALFDPRTAFLDLGFSAQGRDDLSAGGFSGPAVKPLPVLRQAIAGLQEAGGTPNPDGRRQLTEAKMTSPTTASASRPAPATIQ